MNKCRAINMAENLLLVDPCRYDRLTKTGGNGDYLFFLITEAKIEVVEVDWAYEFRTFFCLCFLDKPVVDIIKTVISTIFLDITEAVNFCSNI